MGLAKVEVLRMLISIWIPIVFVHILIHFILLTLILFSGGLFVILLLFIVFFAIVLIRGGLILESVVFLIVVFLLAIRKVLVSVLITIFVKVVVVRDTILSRSFALRLTNWLAGICFHEANCRVFFLLRLSFRCQGNRLFAMLIFRWLNRNLVRVRVVRFIIPLSGWPGMRKAMVYIMGISKVLWTQAMTAITMSVP